MLSRIAAKWAGADLSKYQSARQKKSKPPATLPGRSAQTIEGAA